MDDPQLNTGDRSSMARVASSAHSGMTDHSSRTPKHYHHQHHPRRPQLLLSGAEWVEDDTVDVCSNERCRRAFTFLVGKHHCRWCGRIFCDPCAPRRRRAPRGECLRCCASCTLPVIFRSVVNPVTGAREAGPLPCIMSFLTPKSNSVLMQTCSTMLREFPVGGVPYQPSIQARFPSFYDGAQIGKGAFGVVYKCQDRLSAGNGYVAIKRLIKRRALTYAMWCKILTETRVLQSVHHPHIASIIEVFQTTEDLVIVMEAGQGGNLRQAVSYLYAHRLPVEPFAATVLAQISAGLQYLYEELGIIHRDVKLDNIVVSADYTRAMLIDFGLAEYVVSYSSSSSGGGEGETQSFVAAGTPGFASPENIYAAAVNQAASFEATGPTMVKADLFSLGVTAFVMLSRHRPFRSQRFNRQYLEVERGISCTGPGWEGVSPEAARLVARLLSLRPEDRPDSAAIAKDPFVLQQSPKMAEIAAYRRAAQERDDEEERNEWVVVDVPAPLSLGDSADCEQFPVPRRSLLGSIYGAVLGRSWWV